MGCCQICRYHEYPIVIVENVIQLRDWPLYSSWLHAMYALGYLHKTVYANSKFFWPTPQSRDRMYIVFWKKGNKAPDLEYHPVAYCPKCEKNTESIQSWKRQDKKYGIYGKRGQYVYKCPACAITVEPYYYAAFNAIDWADKGRRIGDLSPKEMLVENTLKRINHGLDKYGTMPFYYQQEHSSNLTQNVRPLVDTLPSQTTRQTAGVVFPFIINNMNGGYDQLRTRMLNESLFAQTTYQSQMLLTPPPLPFIVNDQNSTGIDFRVRSTAEQFQAVTTVPNMKVIFQPFIVENKGTSNSRAITDTLGSQTTVAYQGIVTDESWQSFITYYNSGSDQVSTFYDSLGTLPTKQRHTIVQYQKPNIEDCYYRMLKTHEGKRAMAFADTHIVTGNTKEVFKQLGNAVTPPVPRWIVKQCIATLL